MRAFRLTSVLIALAAAALVTGCGPEYDGYPDRPDHPGYPGPRDGYGNGSGDVQGTVVRVGRRDHVIVLDSSDTGDRYDRRGGYRRNGGGEVALFYDDNTTVEYQGRTFRPEDLERGDRIQANVARTGDDRLVAQAAAPGTIPATRVTSVTPAIRATGRATGVTPAIKATAA